MTFHVTVLGIDGSGKSTLVAALPAVLAAELGVIAGSAGEEFRIAAPDQDLVGPGFHPEGLPLSARLASRLKRRAKALADDPKRYPRYKLAQMLFQDAAARKLARRYRAEVFVSDGNTLLSATGRAANYRRPASEGRHGQHTAPDVLDLEALFRHLLDETPLPERSAARLPSLDRARSLKRLLKLFRLDAVYLPDAVIFLDLSPEAAASRIAARGAKVDRHENLDDLRQAREMYRKTLQAYIRYRPGAELVEIPVDRLNPGEVLERAVSGLRARLEARASLTREVRAPLGTTTEDLSTRGVLRKVLNVRYLFSYLVAKWFEGSWREPLFVLSKPGRQFLREGYSAGVMRVIYDGNGAPRSWADSVFYEYPLHRAVYDRLQILTAHIERELESRLAAGASLQLVTGPSGVGYDLFRPLSAIAARRPEVMTRLRLAATDLDPYGILEGELTERARTLGIPFRFVRGDMTSVEIRSRLAEWAPFDVALFVGLSSWISKPALLGHFRWLRAHLRPGGLLVTDSFTAGAYALSGKYVGYRAHYYEPAVYRPIADYCGFDAPSALLESGRDGINHVMIFRPRG